MTTVREARPDIASPRKRIPPAAWAIVAVLLAVVSVQGGAAVAKSLFPMAGPMGMTALRTAFAALLLGAVLRPWRGVSLTRPGLKAVLGYGASLGYMNLLFYLALQRLPLGIAVAVEFTGPFVLALLSSRRAADFLWAALAVAGLAGLLPWRDVTHAIDPLGVGYALGAGTCWALYIVFGRRAGSLLSGRQATGLGMATAALATLPFGLAASGPILFSPSVLGLGLVVGLLSSAVPYPLEMVALRRLPIRTFGILTSLEPAIAAISGMILLGEDLSVGQWAAVIAVVIASLGSTATVGKE